MRRIFPALFVMLAVSAALAVWLLLPFELADFAGSLRAAALFVSNFYFRQETGYFVAAATTKPLLHTWSLAIEEQFYIFFPLWLWAMSRWARAWLLPATVAVLLASLVVCVAMTHPQSDAAFFWTPARVWELLAGSVLALAPRVRVPGGVAQGLGAAGLVLIAVAVFGFDARTPFPGSAALLPVAGAGLVIFGCGQGPTWVGRLLSMGAVRFVGLISYSLYLWHWPLIVFYRFWRVAPPAWWEMALVVAAAFAVATLSWWFVERPFRVRAVLARRGGLFAGGAAAMAGAVVFGMVAGRRAAGTGAEGGAGPGRGAVRRGGFLGVRFAAGRAALRDRRGRGGGGEVRGLGRHRMPGALMPAFEAAARADGTTGLYLGAAGCVPLVGVSQMRWGFEGCAQWNEDILDAIAARPEVGTVVLVSRWAFYALGERFGGEPGPPVFILDGETGGASLAENGRVFARGLARTVGLLKGLHKRVVIVNQAPENEFDLAVAMARAAWLGKTVEFAPSRPATRRGRGSWTGCSRASGAEVLDLGAVLCGAERCPVARDGVPLYHDSNHLAAGYARELGPVFQEVFR